MEQLLEVVNALAVVVEQLERHAHRIAFMHLAQIAHMGFRREGRVFVCVKVIQADAKQFVGFVHAAVERGDDLRELRFPPDKRRAAHDLTTSTQWRTHHRAPVTPKLQLEAPARRQSAHRRRVRFTHHRVLCPLGLTDKRLSQGCVAEHASGHTSRFAERDRPRCRRDRSSDP